jgi:hypothetical protein
VAAVHDIVILRTSALFKDAVNGLFSEQANVSKVMYDACLLVQVEKYGYMPL